MIGAPVRRREDERLLRGESRFVDDIVLPGVAHVAFVRSPVARAAITSVAVPVLGDGVFAVLTAEDLGDGVVPFPVAPVDGAQIDGDAAHPILARDEVRYVGQPVAAVLAESRALAEDFAEAVDVAYEPLAVVVEPCASDEVMVRWSGSGGDVDAAFARASCVVRGSYALPRLVAAPIEARGCVAAADEDLLTVWISAQDTHRPLAQLSRLLGRPPETIRVIVPDVGGAFGSKGVIAPEVAVVAWAAVMLRRPLKWTEDRYENFVAAYQGRGISGELSLALDADGRMLALRAVLTADLGAYLLTTTPRPPVTAAMLLTGCYDIPAASVVVRGVRTNKVPTGPYRGAGRPDAAYMIERLVDDAARVLGMDRVALRRRNLVRRFPHSTPLGYVYDSGDYERCLDLALSLGAADERLVEGSDWVLGSGIALIVERAGGAWESASVSVDDGGRVIVRSSASPHGQGHDTTFTQIACDRLGVTAEQVSFVFGDSALVPPGVGTFGSRSVAVAGSAVALACSRLASRARSLGVPVLSAGLAAEARFESETVFSSGAYCARVAIERSTGRLHVLRLAAVDDAGVVVNPLLAHGQVIGGAVQGLGECLVEEAVYGEGGAALSGGFMSYSLLTAADVPPIVCGEVCTPSPLNPLGAKGMGEGGAIGSLAAVSCAVADALGGRHVDPPFTDEKLWRALR